MAQAAASKATKKPYDVGIYSRFGLAGALCCSVTHTAVVPIDVVKTRLQTSPELYRGMFDGFRKISSQEGPGMLLKGAGPTFVGYFMQGAVKFGGNEFFKKKYYSLVGEKAQQYRLPIWMASSASAEFFADLFLCPMEATRIRLVSQPTFAKGLLDGGAKILRQEGVGAFYKGLPPLLFKQVPYTVAKFTVFEIVAEAVWKAMPVKQADASTPMRLTISLGSGLASGVAAAIISQPADTVLSKINQVKTDQGSLRAIGSIIRDLGPRKLFLGLGARCVMVGAITAGQFFIYDWCKLLMDVSPERLAAKGY